MNLKLIANKWNRLNNPSVMGTEVARKAGQIADFFNNIYLVCYDTYTTDNFSSYVEGLLRGYQINENAYDTLAINTTLNLHNVTCSSFDLKDFDDYISELWKDYFMYALDINF